MAWRNETEIPSAGGGVFPQRDAIIRCSRELTDEVIEPDFRTFPTRPRHEGSHDHRYSTPKDLPDPGRRHGHIAQLFACGYRARAHGRG